MKTIFAATCVALLLGLSGCTTPAASPYAPLGGTGGYSETQLEPDIWRVGYYGNGYTSPDTVQTFWLYHCAELALVHGYDGFQIYWNGQLKAFKQPAPSTAQPVYFDVKPSLEADVKFLKKPFAADPPQSFDAAALKAALEPAVKGKLCDIGNVCPHAHDYLGSGAAN